MPLEEQPRLICRIASWLLATVGAGAWTGTEDNWLGGTATMWWSHADAATYREWIIQAGLPIESEDFVPEAEGGHELF